MPDPLATGRPDASSAITLDLERVFAGEFWRLVTFVFVPPMTNPIFLFFGLYLFWIMSSALEAQWGKFRFNVYMAVGWAVTVVCSITLTLLDPKLIEFIPQNGFGSSGRCSSPSRGCGPTTRSLIFFIIPVKG